MSSKPVDFNMLKWLIQRASVLHGLELDGKPTAAETAEGMGGMIGMSESIRECFSAIRKIAA